MPRTTSGAVWALLLITFVGSLGFTITLPLMPYYAAEFGADPFMIGALSAVYAACALIAGPILGRLSDRHGRRPWLLFSQVGTAVGFAITAVGGSFWVLLLGRLIDGVSGGNQVIAQAYVADVTQPAERTRVYGLMGAAFGLGAIVGPLLGGGLSRFGYGVPFWVAAGISAITFVATWRFLPEPRRERAAPEPQKRTSLRGLLAEPALRPLLALYGVMTVVFGLFVASIGLYMQLRLGADPLAAGLMVAYYGVVSVALQVGLVGRVTRRFGERRMALFGLLTLGAAMTALALAATLLASLLGVTLLVLGMALLRPAATSMVSQTAGPTRQGAVMGALQSIQSLADIVAPLAGGALIAAGAPSAPFVAAAVIALAGLALLHQAIPAPGVLVPIVEPPAASS